MMKHFILSALVAILVPLTQALHTRPGFRPQIQKVGWTNTSAPAGWDYVGCFSEGTDGRALTRRSPTGGSNLTLEACTKACAAEGYNLAGVEYASECWCDSWIQNSAHATEKGRCNMACAGSHRQICGGPDALSLYQRSTRKDPPSVPAGWRALGCYEDGNNGRALSRYIEVPGGPQNVTVEKCLRGCQAASPSYTYAGLEYGHECWCDSEIGLGGLPTTSGCTMPCTGNKRQLCGGSLRLNMYKRLS